MVKNMQKKGKKHKLAVILIPIVLVLAVGGSVLLIHKRMTAKNQPETVKKQSTVRLSKMDLTQSVSATGTIASASSRSVSASLTDATVDQIKVAVGDTVKKGDVLVIFDQEKQQSALSEAQDNLSDAVTSAKQEVDNAQEQYTQALETQSEDASKNRKEVASAKKTLETAKAKVQTLKAKLAATRSAKDKAQIREQLAQARTARTQAAEAYENACSTQSSSARQNKNSVSQAKMSVSTAKSNQTKTVKEAQNQVDTAREELEQCTVTAPCGGTVTTLSVAKGDSYSGGEILQIEKTNSLMVEASVDEYDISDVEVGQKVILLTEATDEDELEGEVTFVSPTTQSSSSSTSTQQNTAGAASSSSDGYEVKIQIKTKDDRLKIGMTARCSIVKEEASDVYAVPYDAITQDKDGNSTITVKQGDDTKEITVTKGMESDYYVEVTGDDLQEGLEVVIPTDEVSTKSSDSDKGQDSGLLDGMNGMKGGSGGPDGAGGPGGNGGPGGGNGGAPGGN